MLPCFVPHVLFLCWVKTEDYVVRFPNFRNHCKWVMSYCGFSLALFSADDSRIPLLISCLTRTDWKHAFQREAKLHGCLVFDKAGQVLCCGKISCGKSRLHRLCALHNRFRPNDHARHRTKLAARWSICFIWSQQNVIIFDDGRMQIGFCSAVDTGVLEDRN